MLCSSLCNLNQLGRTHAGEGLVLGVDQTGSCAVQVYWMTGRQSDSHSVLKLCLDGDRLFTKVVDPAKTIEPNQGIYNAMRRSGNSFIVGNGNQTDAAVPYLKGFCRRTLQEVLNTHHFDANATPRITGNTYIQNNGSCLTELALLRMSEVVAQPHCLRFYYDFGHISPGVGFCLTTHSDDGDSLLPFFGEPKPYPLTGNAEYILNTYWAALNKESRVSIAVKFIYLGTAKSRTIIKNRCTKCVVG